MRRKQGRRDEQESYDLADVNEQEQAKDGYEERESAFEQEQESAARIDSKKDEDMPFEKAELERAEPRALPPAEEQVFSKFEETDKQLSNAKISSLRYSGRSAVWSGRTPSSPPIPAVWHLPCLQKMLPTPAVLPICITSIPHW
jgi:hypothetical protein